MVQKNLVNLILTSTLAMVVENRVISRLDAPIMKPKKSQTSRRRKRENQKDLCSMG